MAGLLSIERHRAVALVTLRRAERRNALSIELRLELADAFGRLSGDADVGCVVLTGAGSAFCSGMDTTQFGGDLEHRKRLVETSTVAFEAVGGCRRPIVAAVNGPAIAGGFALALLCDLRIASTSTLTKRAHSASARCAASATTPRRRGSSPTMSSTRRCAAMSIPGSPIS